MDIHVFPFFFVVYFVDNAKKGGRRKPEDGDAENLVA
jgi:hypothetical protein